MKNVECLKERVSSNIFSFSLSNGSARFWGLTVLHFFPFYLNTFQLQYISFVLNALHYNFLQWKLCKASSNSNTKKLFAYNWNEKYLNNNDQTKKKLTWTFTLKYETLSYTKMSLKMVIAGEQARRRRKKKHTVAKEPIQFAHNVSNFKNVGYIACARHKECIGILYECSYTGTRNEREMKSIDSISSTAISIRMRVIWLVI